MSLPLRNMTSVFLKKGGRLLLLHRRGGRVAGGKWIGSAGGHFECDELNNPTACVLREMREELGLTPNEIEGLVLRYITLRHVEGEVRQNYYFFASLAETCDRPLSSTEGDLRWFSLEELPLSDMPFTARFVMGHYLSTGIHDGRLYGGIATEERVLFTSLTDS